MKIADIMKMTEAEMKKTLTSLREQVRDVQFKIHSKEVKNNHTLSAIKKDIARILTVMNAK
jgi:large subunit ribosomal protein L29